jgi:hypothetical protein
LRLETGQAVQIRQAVRGKDQGGDKGKARATVLRTGRVVEVRDLPNGCRITRIRFDPEAHP